MVAGQAILEGRGPGEYKRLWSRLNGIASRRCEYDREPTGTAMRWSAKANADKLRTIGFGSSIGFVVI